jgi:hypothetical protein
MSFDGSNARKTFFAPPARLMNLCNIHIHKNAEHKGPGFDRSAGGGEHGGWECTAGFEAQSVEMQDPGNYMGGFPEVKVGDTIEAHWVFTSCDVTPGKGLTSCMTDRCKNPVLRVESQVFMVLNKPQSLRWRGTNFADYAYKGNMVNGLHQPLALPGGGPSDQVTYAGSTTGPKYSDKECSPYHVTWSVRDYCDVVDVTSLRKWAVDGNVFDETHAHGVRKLVTDPNLLSEIPRRR